MVVREKVGRKRYILFLSKGKNREEIIEMVKGKYYLAYYSKNFGIIRCRHTEKEKAIQFLKKHSFKTLKTSGTIKKLKEYISSSLLNEAM